MKNSKIIFAIPTIFRKVKQEAIKKCFNKLLYQCELNDITYKIFIVGPHKNNDFKNWQIESKNIVKKFSDVKFNISVSLNMVIAEIKDDNYFCFIHDDQMILDDCWIQDFINIYEYEELKCGVLGLRSHYHGRSLIKKIPFLKRKAFIRKFKYEIQEHTFVDGVMFISVDRIKKVGDFDENYFGDCESEDYNYRIREIGYKDYRVLIPNKHFSAPFELKIDKEENQYFLDLIKKSRLYKKRKWSNKPAITKNLV